MSLGPYHDELYEQVLPLHGPDPDGLARDYVGACAHGVIEVDDLVRDTDAGPGWGVILDVDDAPVKGLPWLAQIAGVQLRGRKVVTDAVPNSNGELGATYGWVSSTTASPATLTFALGTGLAGAGFHSRIQFAIAGSYRWYPIRPRTPAAMVRVRPGVLYGFSLTVHLTHSITLAALPDGNMWLRAFFYDADLNLIEESTLASDTNQITTYSIGDTVLYSGWRQAPAGAAYAGVGLWVQFVGDGAGADVQFDVGEAVIASIAEESWSAVPAWPYGGPRAETEDEYALYARDAIRRQGGKRRGTPDAMRSAVEDTLTGMQYVNILERVGGNAYALTLVTRPSETPDPDATYRAALTQKPLGMALTHTLSETVTIDEGTKTIDTVTATIDAATISDVAD